MHWRNVVMNQVKFRQWLEEQGVKPKVQTDFISRLKRVEKELNHVDIDEEYDRDNCKNLCAYFEKNGKNKLMDTIKNTTLPIGQYSMSTFRYAIKKYMDFREDSTI